MEEDGRRRAETKMEAATVEEGLPAEGHLFSDDQKKAVIVRTKWDIFGSGDAWLVGLRYLRRWALNVRGREGNGVKIFK